MVPYALELPLELATKNNSLLSRTIVAMMKHLVSCYRTHGKIPHAKELAATSGRTCCMLYSKLSDRFTADRLWRAKQTFHVFIQLAECLTIESGDPYNFWAYMDVDYVGYTWRLAMRRGGLVLFQQPLRR